MMRARLAMAQGAGAEALRWSEQALASSRNVHSEDPLKDRYLTASIYRLAGDARQRIGDPTGARVAWTKAYSLLPKGVPETPLEMDEHSTILKRLGRLAEAEQIGVRLNAMGYRSSGLKTA
jgi:hypothetical protein